MSTSSSFELLENGTLPHEADASQTSVPYAEGTTIDWHREEAAERADDSDDARVENQVANAL